MSFNAELGKLLHFTAEDLAHNQRGELSAGQNRKLRVNGFITFLVAMVAGGALMLWGIVMLSSSQTVWGILCLGSGGILGLLGWLFFKDMLTTRTVLSFEAKVEKVEWVVNRGRFVFVGEHRFKVDYGVKFAPDVMAKRWKFYYVKPDILLSVEVT